MVEAREYCPPGPVRSQLEPNYGDPPERESAVRPCHRSGTTRIKTPSVDCQRTAFLNPLPAAPATLVLSQRRADSRPEPPSSPGPLRLRSSGREPEPEPERASKLPRGE